MKGGILKKKFEIYRYGDNVADRHNTERREMAEDANKAGFSVEHETIWTHTRGTFDKILRYESTFNAGDFTKILGLSKMMRECLCKSLPVGSIVISFESYLSNF